MNVSRSRTYSLAVAACAFLAAMALAVPAFATLDDTPTVESVSNPHLWIVENPSSRVPDEFAEGHERQGWGNSFWPDMTFKPPSGAIGYYYDVVRPGAFPSPGDWSGFAQSSMMSGTYDMLGIYAGLSSSERAFVPSAPGQVPHHALEGRWNLNLRYYGQENGRSQIATRSWTVDFGIDVTPPKAVQNLRATTVGNVTAIGSNGATEVNRRRVSFDVRAYDEMSGVVRYHLYSNDTKILTLDSTHTAGSTFFTWENVPVGKTRLGVRAEDRAGNLGPISYTPTPIIVDPDVPTLSIAHPGSNQYVGGIQTFEVKSTDAAGAPRVTIKVDGRIWRDLARGPYKMQIDTRWLSDGYHTMTVTSKDLFGHTKTVTRGFYVDNRRIRLSSISDSPDPFYPFKVDGIKDKTTIKTYLDEGATDLFLNVHVTNSAFDKSPVMQRHWTRVGRGTFATSWDGRISGFLPLPPFDAKVGGKSVTLYYQWTARDRAGNWTLSGKYPVTFRNYEIVRSGDGTIRIVPR